MTNEQLERATLLKKEIDRLYAETYNIWGDYGLEERFERIVLTGIRENGEKYQITEVSPELLEAIKDWYDSKLAKLEAEFEGM
jgi:hypothetical protein